MNTEQPAPEPTDHASNARLRVLVKNSGLTQIEALRRFNAGIGLRPIAESTWKGYFCQPGAKRYRKLHPDLLEHAEKVFTTKS